MSNLDQVRVESLWRVLDVSARARRQEINNYLFDCFAGTVQSGPFQGMRLSRDASWMDGDISPKLLGVYEQEMHPTILQLSSKPYSTIINIGCGEGYYSVGLARMMPDARILAFDNNIEAQRICRDAAEMNSVADRVEVGGACDVDNLESMLSRPGNHFLFLDCEGAEVALLDPQRVPRLGSCDFVVECHDFSEPSVTQTLVARFQETHDIETIYEQGRDPNQFEVLRQFNSLDRYLAVCEFRPSRMHWLSCRARKDGAGMKSY